MVRRHNTLEGGYKPCIFRLMAYIDEAPGGNYPRMIEWSQEQLLDITPDTIVIYFKKLAYGTPAPDPNDMPTHCRSSNFQQASSMGRSLGIRQSHQVGARE
jgi:hypothetical protein